MTAPLSEHRVACDRSRSPRRTAWGTLHRGTGKRHVRVRFYGMLNDHLPIEGRQRDAVLHFDVSPSVKAVIEAFGVPHVEVALMIRSCRALQFTDRVSPDDRIAVYPALSALDVSGLPTAAIMPPQPRRFVADIHLRRLSRWLRLLGIDTEGGQPKLDLVRESIAQRRILLTRDRCLLMRSDLRFGYWVRSTDPVEQVTEVMQRFDLAGQMQPLSRCSVCNGLLASVAKQDVVSQLPPRTALWLDEYVQCGRCGKLYWKGTHAERIGAMIDRFEATHADRSLPGAGQSAKL